MKPLGLAPRQHLEHAKETFTEAKKSSAEASTLGSKDQPEARMDPSMPTTFLETCVKLLRDNKAVKGYRSWSPSVQDQGNRA